MLYGSQCWALSKADARKIDALDQWCLRRILDIRWYHHVSNRKVRRMTEQPPLTAIIQKRRLMLFGHLARMVETADARRILTGVHSRAPLHLLDGHFEERSISAQSYLRGCYRAGLG